MIAKSYNGLIEPALGEFAQYLPWLKVVNQKKIDPEPYTYLAKVYIETGDRVSAFKVLAEREKQLREASWYHDRARIDGSWQAGVRSVFSDIRRGRDKAFGALFGYGYLPGRAFGFLFPLLVFTASLFSYIYSVGQMAPNSDVILSSIAWIESGQRCNQADFHCGVDELKEWNKAGIPSDYETFSAFLYAIDLFVPLDALGQESTWAPSKDRGFWGAVGYWARMPIQMAGWIITAVGAAVLTGLVGRKD